MRLGLVRGKLEQVERAFDVHVMRRHRRELRAGGQQRREMKNQVDFELRQDPLEQVGVQNRAGELALHEARDRGSSALTSSETTARLRCSARLATSAWPISPLAPVIRTTGFRIGFG